ncbi:MAG: hypothetical protein AAFV88_21590, partial [Planctomycetota bacterium]
SRTKSKRPDPFNLIAALLLTHYSPPGTVTRTRLETFVDPKWEIVERELRSMDSYEKPLLDLLQHKDLPGANMLSVTGGNGVFHVQIADAQMNWHQAFDPEGPSDTVEVWRSDQGFEAPQNWTWSIDDAATLVRYYYQHGKPHPDYNWL